MRASSAQTCGAARNINAIWGKWCSYNTRFRLLCQSALRTPRGKAGMYWRKLRKPVKPLYLYISLITNWTLKTSYQFLHISWPTSNLIFSLTYRIIWSPLNLIAEKIKVQLNRVSQKAWCGWCLRTQKQKRRARKLVASSNSCSTEP